MRFLGFEISRQPTLQIAGTEFESRTIRAKAPPMDRPASMIPGAMAPYGTGDFTGTVSGGPDITDRAITSDPRQLWYLSLPEVLTPKQISQLLRSGLGGDIFQTWQLCAKMRDTWPMFRKCEHELREAVSNARFIVNPYFEDGQDPSESAIEKADIVIRAMKNFRPDPFSDEREFSGMIYDITDAMSNGVTISEIIWHKVKSKIHGKEIMPRASAFVHPRHFTFTNDGKIALFNDDYRRLQWNDQHLNGLLPDSRKFLCAQFINSGSCLGAGLMRPLAWYWAAVILNKTWMLKAAQNYGSPFLDVVYKPGTEAVDLARLDGEITKGLANRYVRHVEGTQLHISPAQSLGSDNPQRFLADEADRACQFLLLGQTGTTSETPGKLGGSDTHESVKRERVEGLAKWVCSAGLKQFARAVLMVNYGDDSECPEFSSDFTEEINPKEQAQTDQIFLSQGVPMRANEFYKANRKEQPKPGDLVIIGGKMCIMPEPVDTQADINAQKEQSAIIAKGAQPTEEPSAEPEDEQEPVESRLARMSNDELDKIGELILAAERAPHMNGELKALEMRLKR